MPVADREGGGRRVLRARLVLCLPGFLLLAVDFLLLSAGCDAASRFGFGICDSFVTTAPPGETFVAPMKSADRSTVNVMMAHTHAHHRSSNPLVPHPLFLSRVSFDGNRGRPIHHAAAFAKDGEARGRCQGSDTRQGEGKRPRRTIVFGCEDAPPSPPRGPTALFRALSEERSHALLWNLKITSHAEITQGMKT